MRLINADALKEKLYNEPSFSIQTLYDVMNIVNSMPTVQPEQKKGKWIRKSPTAWSWTCSCCKKDNSYAYSAGESFEPDVLQDLFCPNCGADMRGEQDG